MTIGMKKGRLLLLMSCCLGKVSVAQQEPMNTQFQNTLVHVNPAMASIHYSQEANLQYRYQSENTNGSPTSFFANGSCYLRSLSGALGMSYSYNQFGLFREHKALVHYAYHLKVNRKIKTSAGVAFGVGGMDVQSATWMTSAFEAEPGVPVKSSDVAFQFNSGIVVSAKKWRIGISATQINQPVYHLEKAYDYKGLVHGYVFGECQFQFNGGVALLPSIKIGTDFNFYSYTSLLRLKMDRLIAGISYSQHSMSTNFGVLLGYNFGHRYELSYSYEYASGRLDYLKSIHEFSLAIRLRKSRAIVCGIGTWSF